MYVCVCSTCRGTKQVGGAESFVVLSVAVHFGFWVAWGPERVCGPAETVLASSGVALFSGEMLVRAKLGDPADVSFLPRVCI